MSGGALFRVFTSKKQAVKINPLCADHPIRDKSESENDGVADKHRRDGMRQNNRIRLF